VRGVTHDCSKRYCEKCKQKREVGHLCYVRPLKDIFPANAGKVLYAFYYFETTKISAIPILLKHVCLISSACNSFVRGERTRKTV